MILSLLDIDQQLFQWVNTTLSNDFFDLILPLIREKLFWVPLYLFIVAFSIFNFKKNGWFLVLFLFLNFGISDTLSSKIVKESVQRIRPCNDVQMQSLIIKRVPCGGGYSFTSSHATNHFALSFFLITTIGFISKRLKISLFIWAFAVSFAQIYVGVHYPIDILGGALLGIMVGKLLGRLFNYYFTLDPNVLELSK